MAINTLVLKVASRCNLNCSYCYMYNLGDKTYKNQPKFMSDEVVDAIILETKKYLIDNNGKNFQFVFHGGEPLLIPKEWYKKFVDKVNRELHFAEVFYSLQTNGVLYDEEWIRSLDRLGIPVGISWDGPEEIHNEYRTFHNGKGSYSEVLDAVELHKKIIGHIGGLSVVNAKISPLVYYNNIKEIGFTSCSLLLPHLHHSMKSEFKIFNYDKERQTFGRWLADLFDIWWNDEDENKPGINYFNEYIRLLMGDPITTECVGEGENNVLVIETNGDIESSAALKSCGEGFTKEGNNILKTSLEEVMGSELVKLFVNSHKNLSDECNNCEIKSVCGGGRINQRFSEENGFDNPSVYCEDIKYIVSHIQNELYGKFDNKELEEFNLKILEYGHF